MLGGEFKHTLDAKGRIFLPAKFRDDLGGQIMIVRGLDRCLVAYSEGEWERFVSKLDALGEMSREIKRYLMKSAQPCEPDAQGRVILSQDHRDYAQLNKEVSFLGMGTYVEIWNSEALASTTDSYDTKAFKDILLKAGF